MSSPDAKLEGLRTEYEEQVSSLRAQLGEALHSPTKQPQTDQQHPLGFEAPSSGDLCEDDLDEGHEVTSEAGVSCISMTSSVFQQELAALKRTARDYSGLERLEQAYADEIKQLQQSHQTELQLQLEALKLTLDQVHSGQLRLVREELEEQNERSLEVQKAHYQDTIRDMQQHQTEHTGPNDPKLNLTLQQDMDKVRQYFEQQLTESEEQYEETVANLQAENAQLKETLKAKDSGEMHDDVPSSKELLRVKEVGDEANSISSMGDFSQADYSTSLVAELQGEIESYRIQIESYKQESEERRQCEIETLREKFQLEYNWKIDDLKNQHREEMDALERELKEEFSSGQLVRSSQEETQRLKRELVSSQEQIEMLKAKHREQIERIRTPSPQLLTNGEAAKAQGEELKKIKLEHEEELCKVKEDQKQTIEELKREHRNEKEDILAKHQMELAACDPGNESFDLDGRIELEVSRVKQEHQILLEKELEAARDQIKDELKESFNQELLQQKKAWEERQEKETQKLARLHELALGELSNEIASVQEARPDTPKSSKIRELENTVQELRQEKACVENDLKLSKIKLEKLEKQSKKQSSKSPWNKTGVQSNRGPEVDNHIEELERKVEEREVQIEELQTRLEDVENSLRDKEQVIKNQSEKISDYDDRVDMYKSQLALFENTIGDNEAQIDELTEEVEDYKTQLEELTTLYKARIHGYEDKIKGLKAKLCDDGDDSTEYKDRSAGNKDTAAGSKDTSVDNLGDLPSEDSTKDDLVESDDETSGTGSSESQSALLESYKKEISDLNKLFAEKEQDYNDLKAKHKKAVTNLTMQLAQSDDKYETLMKKKNQEIHKLSADLSSFSEKHQEEVDSLKQQLRDSRSVMDEGTKVVDLDEYVSIDIENGDVRSTLVSEVSPNVHSQAAEHEEPSEKQSQIEKMNETFQEEKDKLEAEHKREIEKMTEQHLEEMEKTRSNHEQELVSLKQELLSQKSFEETEVRSSTPDSCSGDEHLDKLAERLDLSHGDVHVPQLSLPLSDDDDDDDNDDNDVNSDRDSSSSHDSDKLLAYSRVLEEAPNSTLSSTHGSMTDSIKEAQELELTSECVSQNLKDKLNRFEADHTGELDDIQAVLKEQMLNESMEKIHGMTAQLESEHQEELNQLRSRYEQIITSLKEQIEENRGGGCESRLRMASDSSIENGDLVLRSDLEDLSLQHQNELDDLHLQHQHDLDDLHKQHQHDLDTLHEQHQEQLQKIETQLNELALSKDSEIQKHICEVERLQEVFTSEKDSLRVQLIQEKESELDLLNTAKSALSEQIKNCEEKERASAKEIEQYQSEIASLRTQLSAEEDSEEITTLKQTILERIEEIKAVKANNDRVMLEKDARISQLEADVDCKASEIQRLRSEDQTDARHDVTSLLKELKEEQDKRDLQVQDLQEELEKRDSQLKDLQEVLDKSDLQVKELKEELQKELEKRDSQLKDLQEVLEKGDIQVKDLQEEVNKRDMEVKDLHDEAEGKLEALRAQLAEEKDAEIDDVRQRLQMEISALRQSLEAVDAEKETEMQREYGDSLERLREQHFTEIAVKNEQLEKLSADLIQKGEAVQRISRQVDDYEEQLELQASQLDTLLKQRQQQERQKPPSEDDDNLLMLLRADLERVTVERDATQQANEQIMRLLSESVRTAVVSTDNIQQRLDTLTNRHSPRSPPLPDVNHDSQHAAALSRSPPGEDVDTTLQNTSILSSYTDEGLDISQHFAESMFLSQQPDADTDEVVSDANGRLQGAVERLLDMISDTTKQLQEAQKQQTQLLADLKAKGQQVTDLTQKCEELEQRVREEMESKEYLAVELSKTEGLLHGYEEEKVELDISLRSLEDKKEVLAEELERAHIQLAQYSECQGELVERENDIRRQRETLEKSIGHEEQVALADASSQADLEEHHGLLQENTKLSEEKRSLQRQHEQQLEELNMRINALEATVEELQADNEAIVEERKIIIEDQQNQIEALEKQLRTTKQFLEDQTAEREQEREEFIAELQSLKGDMQDRNKQDSAQQRLTREVLELEDHLREKTDATHELSLKKEQVERDLLVAMSQVDELKERLRENEVESEGKDQTLSRLNKKLESAENELTKQHDDDEADDDHQEAELGGAEGLRRIIQDLEARLDTAKESERRSGEKIKSLEEELKNLHNLEDELTLHKKTLEKQVNEQLREISALRIQVEGSKFAGMEKEVTPEQRREIQELQFQLEDEKTAVENKDKQILQLSEQLDDFREQLLEQEEEASQLSAQLQVAENGHKHVTEQLQNTIEQLQTANTSLKTQVDTLRDGAQTSMSSLTLTLLEEKNEEIDQLSAQIAELNQQLSSPGDTRGQHDLTQQIEALKKQLELQASDLEAKDALLKEKQNDLESTATDLQNQQVTLTSAPVEVIQELEVRNQELVQQKEEAEKYNIQVKQLLQDLDSLSQTNQEQVHEIAEKNQLIEDQAAELEASQKLVLQLQTNTSKLNTEKNELEDKDKQIEECIQKLEAKEVEIQDYNTELFEKTRRIHELEVKSQRVDGLSEEVQTKNMELAELQRAIASLRRTRPREQDEDMVKQDNTENLFDLDLNDLLSVKDTQIEELRERLQQRDFEFLQSQEEQHTEHQEALSALRDQLEEKEGVVNELQVQVEHLQEEVASLQSFHTRLQDDFEEVQAMNEAKQKEIEALTHDMEELRPQAEGMTSDLQDQFEGEIRKLTRDVQEKQNIIDEKEEEMYLLNERLEKQQSLRQELFELTELYDKQAEELSARDEEMARLISQLEERNAVVTQEAHTARAAGDSSLQSDATQPQDTQNKQEVWELRSSLEATHQELSSKTSSLDKALHDNAVLSNMLKDQAAEHKVKVSLMQDSSDRLTTEVEQLRQRLSSSNESQQNLQDLEERHQAHLSHLKVVHESRNTQLQQLQEEFDSYKREFLQKHNTELSQLEEKHHEQGTMMQTKYESQIDDLRQRHNTQLNELTEKLQDAVSVSEDMHSTEIRRLTDEHDRLVSKMQTEQQSELVAQREELTRGQRLAVEEVRRSLHRHHTEEIDRLVLEHQREIEELQLNPNNVPAADDDSTVQGPSSNLQGNLHRFIEEMTRPDLIVLDDERSSVLQSILDRVKGGGNSVLTLSDIKFLQDLAANQSYPMTQVTLDQSDGSYHPDVEETKKAWEGEKVALMTAVSSLKTLLVETQKSKDSSKGDDDWRGDLLKAVHSVFAGEQENILAKLHAHEVTHGSLPSTEQLQEDVRDMCMRHKTSMQQLFVSDRQSLLAEIRHLRGQVKGLQDEREKTWAEKSGQEEESIGRERHLSRQLELLQYKLQQEKVLGEDLQHSLEAERSRAQDLSNQLLQQQSCNSDLQQEIAVTQNQLDKLKAVLEQEQGRLVSASNAVEIERKRASHLSSELSAQHKDTDRYRESLETEKLRSSQYKDRCDQADNIISKLRQELEVEKERHLVTTGALEQEKCESARLWRELQAERDRLREAEGRLRSSVNYEKSQSADLQTLLGVSSDVRASLGIDTDMADSSRLERAATRGDVQAAHDLIRMTLRHAQKCYEKQKSQSEREMDTALQTCRDLKNTIESLELEKRELTSELEFAGDKMSTVTSDRERLQASLSSAKNRIKDLESRPSDRMETAVNTAPKSLPADISAGYKRQLETIRQRLQLLAIRHQEELARCSSLRELADSREVGSIRSALNELLTDLQQLQGQLDVPLTASSPHVNEKTLHHNRELTDYIASMSSGMQALRAELSNVEEELLHLRQKEHVYQQAQRAEDDLSSQIAQWSEERTSMSLQLHEAHSEVGRLRDELRRTEIQLEREREKYLPSPASGDIHTPLDRDKYAVRRMPSDASSRGSFNSDIDNSPEMQRLYGKYLRAESFRKALIYQKKYLLTLIGGFEDGEEETLAMLARMGAHPSLPDSQHVMRSKPLFRFRSAVTVVIATTRLRYLMKKWKRATRVGVPVVSANVQNKQGSAYVPSTNGFTPPRRSQSNNLVSHPSSLPVTRTRSANLPPAALKQPSSLVKDPPVGAHLHNGHHYSSGNVVKPARRSLHSALGPMPEPTITPPPSLSSRGGSPRPSLTPTNELTSGDSEKAEQSINDYIQRLENLQQRLGNVSKSSRTQKYIRR